MNNLSHPQKRIWLTDSIHTDLEMSNVGMLVKLNMPDFDEEILNMAINRLIEEDTGTRIRLRSVEENVVEQYISDFKYYETEKKDFIGKNIDEIEAHFRKIHNKKFDMFDSDLFYFCIVRYSDNIGGFYLKAHHIISDGNSAVLNIKKIIRFYNSFAEGTDAEIATCTPYIKYLDSEKKYFDSIRFEHDRTHWIGLYNSLPEPVSLATKTRKKSSQEIVRKYYSFNGELSGKMIEFQNKENYSIFGVFLEFLSIYIHKFTGLEDFTIGIPTHNRYDRQFDNSSGMFVSTLPFRARIEQDTSLSDFHKIIKSGLWKSLKHQKYPYNLLINYLTEKFKTEVNLLNIQLVEIPGFFSEDLEVLRHFAPRHSLSELSIFINLRDKLKDNVVEFSIDYQKDLFDPLDIDLIFERFVTIAEQYFDMPDKKIRDVNILCDTEKDLLDKFNDTCHISSEFPGFLQSFADNVRTYPDKIAVSENGRDTSYSEIERMATSLSMKLLYCETASRSVAVIMKRSTELVSVIIGILKAGLSYIPIEPGTPQDRINRILKESGTSTVITDRDIDIVTDNRIEIIYADTEVTNLTENHTDIEVSKEDIAYMIYTSGSTGNPKGVMITHGNLSNYVNWAADYYCLDDKLVFPLYSSISFDLTVTSIFVPLATGGRIVVYQDEDFENAFLKIFEENQVNTVKLTPSHLRIIQNIKFPATSIKQLIVGGEELTYNLSKIIYRNFDKNIRIINEYGPTEATVGCSVYDFDEQDYHHNTLPIGKPVYNTHMRIIDKNLDEMPVGSTGEICICGDSISAGYVNNPEETSRKFVKIMPKYNSPVYKSGDLGRWSSRGNLEFFGRIDNQVKIRGFRIELEEISSKVEEIDGVDDCIVLDIKSDNDTVLICYYAAKKHIDSDYIRKFLLESLPGYMIPSQFIHIEKMPLTTNGKVNKSLLPKPFQDRKKHADFKKPEDEVEKIIADVWKDILNLDEVGMEENFFELGGDSIKAIQIVSGLRNRGVKLKVKDIFSQLTVRGCRASAELDIIDPRSNEPLEGERNLIPIEEWFFNNEFENINFYNQSVLLEFKETISLYNLEKTMNRLIYYHDGLRMNYDPMKHKVFYNNSFLNKSIFVLEENLNTDEIEKMDLAGLKVKHGGSFDITREMPIKIIVIRCKRKDYLLLIAHHLVIDGVSWRILLNDLKRIYSTLHESGQLISLPPKTSSMREYSEHLYKLKDQEKIAEQTEYWKTIQENRFRIITDFIDEDNRSINIANNFSKIDENVTEYLLKDIFRVHNVTIEEFLLSAVTGSIGKWTGSKEIVVNMESHGRESEECDLSRTIGWFTTIYPVIFYPKNQVGEQIVSVKDSLNSVPDKGIGYGLSKFLCNERLKKQKLSELRFNYLGHLDEENKIFKYTATSLYDNISPENDITAKIEVESYIFENRLKFIIKYNKKWFDKKTIDSLAEDIRNNIYNIYDHLINNPEKYISASSYDTAELDQDELDSLFE